MRKRSENDAAVSFFRPVVQYNNGSKLSQDKANKLSCIQCEHVCTDRATIH